jgi:hypothetical protein
MALDWTYKYSKKGDSLDDMKRVLNGIYGAEVDLFSCFIIVPRGTQPLGLFLTGMEESSTGLLNPERLCKVRACYRVRVLRKILQWYYAKGSASQCDVV